MFPSPKKLDRVFSEESFLLWENPQINIMETIMNDKEHATMLLYGKDGNGPKIEVLLDKDSVWLTQKQMADLFDVDRTVISKHLKTVFSSGELNQDVVCANFAHIARDVRVTSVRVRDAADTRAKSDLQIARDTGDRTQERLARCESLLGEGAELAGEGAELLTRVAADKETMRATCVAGDLHNPINTGKIVVNWAPPF